MKNEAYATKVDFGTIETKTVHDGEYSLKERPLTEEAFQHYVSKSSLGKGVLGAPYTYVPPKETARIAIAIGRKIELEEVKLLVVPDGEMRTCNLDNLTWFQPCRWIHLLDQELKRVKEGENLSEIIEKSSLWNGQFYLVDAKPLAYSGSPFWVLKGGKAVFNSKTALGKVMQYRQNNKYQHVFGLSRERVNQIIETIQRRQQDFQTIRDAFENTKRQKKRPRG